MSFFKYETKCVPIENIEIPKIKKLKKSAMLGSDKIFINSSIFKNLLDTVIKDEKVGTRK
jgi:hypothetical protein